MHKRAEPTTQNTKQRFLRKKGLIEVPQYPTSYQDFIPDEINFLKGGVKTKQTTMMLADFWSVLEDLLEETGYESMNSFIEVINSLPTDKLMAVRVTSNTAERMLVNPWYVFVDTENNNQLRPFVKKAIAKFFKENNGGYIAPISSKLDGLNDHPVLEMPKDPKRYLHIHNTALSNEQITSIISNYIAEIHAASSEEQANELAQLKQAIKGKEQNIEEQRDRLQQLQKQIAEDEAQTQEIIFQINNQNSTSEKLNKENSLLKQTIPKIESDIENLKSEIIELESEKEKLKADEIIVEKRILRIENDVAEFNRRRELQQLENANVCSNHAKYSAVNNWLTEKIDALRIEVVQKMSASAPVVAHTQGKKAVQEIVPPENIDSEKADHQERKHKIESDSSEKKVDSETVVVQDDVQLSKKSDHELRSSIAKQLSGGVQVAKPILVVSEKVETTEKTPVKVATVASPAQQVFKQKISSAVEDEVSTKQPTRHALFAQIKANRKTTPTTTPVKTLEISANNHIAEQDEPKSKQMNINKPVSTGASMNALLMAGIHARRKTTPTKEKTLASEQAIINQEPKKPAVQSQQATALSRALDRMRKNQGYRDDESVNGSDSDNEFSDTSSTNSMRG